MTCPTCGGAKLLRGFACPGFRLVELPCRDCKGTGEVDDVRAIWQREGERLRRFRLARDMSVREAATWVGVSPLEWNDAEHAKVAPGPLNAKVQEKALAAFRRPAPPSGATRGAEGETGGPAEGGGG